MSGAHKDATDFQWRFCRRAKRKSPSSSQSHSPGAESQRQNSRSRAASQFGAQTDEASNRLTRRPATYHHAFDSRARHPATADRLRTVRGLFQPWRDGIPGLPTDRLRARMRSRTGHGHRPVADWTRPRIGHGLPVATDIGAAIWPDRLRIHCGHCADAKTSF